MSVVGTPGYHETSIGWIPSDWALGTVRCFVAGLEAGVSVNAVETDTGCSEDEIGVLKTSAVLRGKFFPKQHKVIVSADIHRAATKVKSDRIIISRMNTPALVGESGYVPNAHSNLFLPDRLWQTIPSDIPHSQRWLSYWLQLPATRRLLSAGSSGTSGSMKNISKDTLLSLPTPLTPLPEQLKIAAILTTVDDKLDVIALQIANTQTLKQGLMQTLFSRGVGIQDAKGRWVPHAEFRESAFGAIPESWKETTLGVICAGALKTGPFGSQLHAAEYQEEGVPVLMPKDLIDGRANIATAARISKERATDLAKHKLVKGDLLFSRRGDVARFALIDEKSEGALCGTGCLKARLTSEHSPAFFSHLLQLDTVRAWLEQNAVGQTMPNMNTSILSSLPLIAPTSLDEEQEIADILDCVDAKMRLLLAKQSNYQSLKRGLMQKLLTGEWRVKSGTLVSEILATDLTVNNVKLPTKADFSLMAEAI